MASYEAVLRQVEDGRMNTDLIKIRTVAGRWSKLRHSMINSQRGHPRLRAGQLLKSKFSVSEPEQLRTALDSYTRAATQLQTLGLHSATWTLEGVQGKVSELFHAAAHADSELTALTAKVRAAAESKASSVQANKRAGLSARRIAQQKLQPFIDHGLPPTFASMLERIGVLPGQDDNNNWLAITEYEALTDPVDSDVNDWTQPAWFKLDEADEGQRIKI